MKLGLSIGYSRAQLEIPVELVQRAEARCKRSETSQADGAWSSIMMMRCKRRV